MPYEDAKSIPLEPYTGFKIDRNGTVYGASGKPLSHVYAGYGVKMVALTKSGHKTRHIKIEKLMGLTFEGIPITERVSVQYQDGDKNNVSLNNLLFLRNK